MCICVRILTITYINDLICSILIVFKKITLTRFVMNLLFCTGYTKPNSDKITSWPRLNCLHLIITYCISFVIDIKISHPTPVIKVKETVPAMVQRFLHKFFVSPARDKLAMYYNVSYVVFPEKNGRIQWRHVADDSRRNRCLCVVFGGSGLSAGNCVFRSSSCMFCMSSN